MTKYFFIFLIVVAIIFINSSFVMADEEGGGTSGGTSIIIPNPLGSQGKDIPTLINSIAKWLLEIGLVISTIIILWAAFLFMTSGGSEAKVTTARQTLWYAIIGLAVLLLATGVTELIKNILSGNF